MVELVIDGDGKLQVVINRRQDYCVIRKEANKLESYFRIRC